MSAEDPITGRQTWDRYLFVVFPAVLSLVGLFNLPWTRALGLSVLGSVSLMAIGSLRPSLVPWSAVVRRLRYLAHPVARGAVVFFALVAAFGAGYVLRAPVEATGIDLPDLSPKAEIGRPLGEVAGCSQGECSHLRVTLPMEDGRHHSVECWSDEPGTEPSVWFQYTTTERVTERCYFGVSGALVWAVVDGQPSEKVRWP